MHSVRWFASLTLVFVLASHAHAQLRCEESDTYNSCAARLAGQLTEVANDALLAGVAAKNTGPSTLSTIADFLPPLRAIVESHGLGGADGTLGFEWSNPLRLPPREQNKLVIELSRPELHEPMKNSLREAGLADQIDALEDKISEADDIGIGFSWSRASTRHGRDPRLHSDIVDQLLRMVRMPKTDDSALHEFEARVFEAAAETDREIDLDAPFDSNGMTPEERTTYMRLVEESILGHHRSMREFGEQLRQLGFYRFLDLVNNQPQWSFTAQYRLRDDAVGPDEIKVSFSYEKGWANVNAYRKYQQRSCNGRSVTDCLASYLAQPSIVATLEQSLRVSIKAEYTKLGRIDFALPSHAFRYYAEPSERFSLTAGFGRYLGGENQGAARTRLDVTFGYEDFSDDPNRQGRGLASATLTFPAANGLFLSFGAVYATRPEFRGDVDEELSARAGVLYKLLPWE
jgi:hypothetical protein